MKQCTRIDTRIFSAFKLCKLILIIPDSKIEALVMTLYKVHEIRYDLDLHVYMVGINT